MKNSDILSIADSSMSFSNWSQEQRERSRSSSPPSPRHGKHASRHDGRHLVSGETPSSGHTEAQTHSKSRARHRRHSSTSSSSSSDDSSSSSSSFRSKASNHNKSKSSGSFSSKSSAGSGENESRSNLVPLRSVSSETVATYERFDIENDVKGDKFNNELKEFCRPFFSKFFNDETLKSKILDKYPVADAGDLFMVKTMDSFISPLLEKNNKQIDKGADKGAQNIQSRVMKVMGPLSTLWGILENLRSASRESHEVDNVDIVHMCSLLEQTVCLLGQASVAVDHHRRINTAVKITGDYKKAKALLEENSEALEKSGDKLFGEKFIKVLKKTGKRRKEANEVADAFQPDKKKRRKTYQNRPFNSSFKPRFRQPFQEGPSSRFTDGRRPGYKFNRNNQNYKKKSDRYKHKAADHEGSNSYKCRRRVKLIFCNQSGKINNISRNFESKSTNHRSTKCNPCRGKNKIFQTKLAKNHKRSCDLKYSSGGFFGLDNLSNSKENSKFAKFEFGAKANSSKRNFGSRAEKCNRKSCSPSRSLYQQHVYSPKEGRGVSTHNQFKTSKCFPPLSTLQNGGSLHGSRSDRKRLLSLQNRPKGCISNNPSKSKRSKVSKIYMERESVSISDSSIRSSQCPKNFHKTFETSCRSIKKVRDETHNLSRRHSYFGKNQRATGTEQKYDPVSLTDAWFQNKLGEIKVKTRSQYFFSRVRNKLCNHALQTSRRKGAKNKKRLQTGQKERSYISQRIISINRDIDFNNASCNSSQATLSSNANVSDQRFVRKPALRSTGPNFSWGQNRAKLVDKPIRTFKRKINHQSKSFYDSNIRCFRCRLGGHIRITKYRRVLVLNRANLSHKCKGAFSRVFGSSIIRKIKKKYSNFDKNRQCNSSSSYQQNGRNQVTVVKSSSKTNLGLVSKKSNHFSSRIHTRNSECQSRLGIKKPTRFGGLDVRQNNFQSDYEITGVVQNRPICLPSESPTSSIFQLESRPRGNGDQCISALMEGNESLHFPPIQSDRQMFIQNKNGTVRNCSHDSTSLASPTMVSSSSRDVNSKTNSSTNFSQSVDFSNRFPASSNNKQIPASSCMEDLGEHTRANSLSREAATLHSQAWRPGTRAAYKSAWGKWVGWCSVKSFDPIHSPLEPVVEFLTALYNDKKQYRTINTYRSAISKNHALVEGHRVGQHPLIVTHMRAIFNMRTPQPRYQESWNVDILLGFIENLGANKDLCLKTLSCKLVALLALTSAGRASELNQLNVKSMSDLGDCISFKLSRPTKTCKPGNPLHSVVFNAFESISLCVVECIRSYLEKTSKFRDTADNIDRSWLLLSYVKPHHPVTTSSIARWLKTIMAEAGINTNLFKAHSTRSASVSKAYFAGVSVSDILQQAHWTKESTFARFYCKPIRKSTFQQSVLKRS
uniref:Uncharacterized protein LOC111112656 n=1 Tax=Crassostrea virginica TaxID=6565 RepID=A0A8B8BT70_CRAVI|nr:uncharacterized protein LOC111112656 [Crassostrea virginica]